MTDISSSIPAATTTVEPSSTSVVTAVVSASSVPGSTQLITSVVFESNTALGGSSLAPVTVVVTSAYEPTTTAGKKGSSSTVVLTTTLGSLPLTTIFTPPSDCSTRPFTLLAAGNDTGVWDLKAQYTDTCYPPDWATARDNHYTPGVCPYGYTLGALFPFGDTTSVGCCLSGMTYITSQGMCQTIITSSTTGFLPSSQTVTITTFPFTGMATPVNVAWATTDLTAFTPTSAPLQILATFQSSPNTTQSSPAAIQSSLATPLSSGANASIGVGVALAVFVLLGAGFLFLRFKKRRKQSHVEPASVKTKSELQGEPIYRKLPTELDPENDIKEMQGNHCIA